ncbi:MAG: cysteine--tRNA ligase [Anaerolineae bacterium]|nr:cysteine--tRNA ligase [Anaerolineae bacterium]
MTLKVYNYLSREMEVFEPIQPGRVGMYVCGPTVYDHSHLGHAKTYVAMDVIVRYLKHLGYQVRHVRNITDVGHLLDSGEDRILRGARRHRLEPMEVVETYMNSFFEDMDALKVQRPNISPRATGHIPEIIQWIRDLLDAGYAYEVAGNVYFSVEAMPDYGKLSRRNVEDLEAGVRVQVRDEKRHPADFSLWKRAEPEHLMQWPSPWGAGYPGWHIECSVMSTKYLGQPFDIHGGGLENIFPHNECEIAQAEAHHDADFAKYWVLVGSLTVNGIKMSKSLGNFLTIKDALALYTPEAIRFFILSGHYRGPVDFSREALEAAQRGVQRLHNTLRAVRDRMGTAPPAGTAILSDVSALTDYRKAFQEAMEEDFNTPQALAVLFEMVKDVNQQLTQKGDLSMGSLAAIEKTFGDLAGSVLGILPAEEKASAVSSELVEGLMDIIMDLRREAREAKEWERADMLRNRLALLGIMLNDAPAGSSWTYEG